MDRIERKYHSFIRTTIREQLTYTPDVETRNRKPMNHPAPYGATWELRFGVNNRFRVLYEIDADMRIVWVLAIGKKESSQLLIGSEEYAE